MADPIGGFDLPSQTKISGALSLRLRRVRQVRDYGLAGANLAHVQLTHRSAPFHTRNSSSLLLPIHNFPISELALKFPILSLT